MNPYRPFVDQLAGLVAQAAAIVPPPTQLPEGQGSRALVFAPHPDDEVIVGALPLRLRRQAGWAVTAVAVTLGSDQARRQERWREQRAACDALGFGLVTPDPAGLDRVIPDARAADPARWSAAVDSVAALLAAHGPALLFLPHAADWHPTHVGTHLLVTDALRRRPDLAVPIVETEFWGAMAAPNLMVESSPADVADLVAALALHAGEVARNPYHLRLPAWMMDNVRRGAELVAGPGSPAPLFTFATLYRLRHWRAGALHDAAPPHPLMPAAAPPSLA